MAKVRGILIICSLAVAVVPLATAGGANPVEDCFDRLGGGGSETIKEKRTCLHFYLQDANYGKNRTVWQVAAANITSHLTSQFGKVSVIDDPVTERPEPDSRRLGQAQGMITFVDMKESALSMAINVVFTEGSKYNGSTLCIAGRNPINEEIRELTVVGGTGVFRMARGIVMTNTYSYDVAAGYGVLEYKILVVHYEDEGRISDV